MAKEILFGFGDYHRRFNAFVLVAWRAFYVLLGVYRDQRLRSGGRGCE